MYKIFVVSDGTGRTAKQALNAALMQFENIHVDIIVRPNVRTTPKLQQVVEEAKREKGFIVHTLVADTMRDMMITYGRRQNVETIDLIGPLLGRLSHQFAATPSEKPGLFSQLNKHYFRRIETMEFAFHHDDGQRLNEIRKAEIILIGVSRTFKTPLSIYLAFKGWFVANIPIVLNIEPPPEVFKLPTGRVFGLNTNATQLAQLRRARHEYFGGEVGSYADPEFVRMELMYARTIFHRKPDWPVISVANKPIEEIASEILALKNHKKK